MTPSSLRQMRDSLVLADQTTPALRAMVSAPVGWVSETTRVLAGFELEAREVRA